MAKEGRQLQLALLDSFALCTLERLLDERVVLSLLMQEYEMIRELPVKCELPKPGQMLQSKKDEDLVSHLPPKIWIDSNACL